MIKIIFIYSIYIYIGLMVIETDYWSKLGNSCRWNNPIKPINHLKWYFTIGKHKFYFETKFYDYSSPTHTSLVTSLETKRSARPRQPDPIYSNLFQPSDNLRTLSLRIQRQTLHRRRLSASRGGEQERGVGEGVGRPRRALQSRSLLRSSKLLAAAAAIAFNFNGKRIFKYRGSTREAANRGRVLEARRHFFRRETSFLLRG